MGWLFGSDWPDRQSLVNHLKSPAAIGEHLELVDSAQSGNKLFLLLRVKATGKRFILLCLMKGGGKLDPGWGYKDIGEWMGPCELGCPERILAQSDDDSDYAKCWRQRCRDAAKGRRGFSQKFVDGLKPGDPFLWKGELIHFHHRYSNKSGQERIAGRNAEGKVYRYHKNAIRPPVAN